MALVNTSLKSWTRLVEFLAVWSTAPFVLLVGLVLYIDYGDGQPSAATESSARRRERARDQIPAFHRRFRGTSPVVPLR